MDITEMEKRFKAAIADLGLDSAQAAALGQQLVATEKEATAQGIAFKSDAQPGADGALDVNASTQIIVPMPGQRFKAANGEMYIKSPSEQDPTGMYFATAVKAAPPVEAMIEEQADDPMIEDVTEEVTEEPTGDYIGDMSWDDFAARLADLLAPVLKMQDMVKAMGDAHAELKTMYGGQATKDDARAQEIAAVKSQQTELAQRLALLEGDQPAVTLPADVEAALKSTGPTTADPDGVEVPNDPNRPLAALAARTMPALYRTNDQGGFAGWTPPTPT